MFRILPQQLIGQVCPVCAPAIQRFRSPPVGGGNSVNDILPVGLSDPLTIFIQAADQPMHRYRCRLDHPKLKKAIISPTPAKLGFLDSLTRREDTLRVFLRPGEAYGGYNSAPYDTINATKCRRCPRTAAVILRERRVEGARARSTARVYETDYRRRNGGAEYPHQGLQRGSARGL